MDENRINTLFCQEEITYFPFEISSRTFSLPDSISRQDAVRHPQKDESRMRQEVNIRPHDFQSLPSP